MKTSFRPSSMPAYRDDFQPLGTAYGERPQGVRWAMSLPLAKQYDCLGCGGQIIENHCKSSFWIFWMLLHDFACADSCQTGSYCANKMQCGKHWGYGCHRNPAWDETLRLPRNPFPGSRAREMTYLREFAEIGVATCPSPSTPLGVGFVS